jgi:hypothetical protein
MRSSLVKIYFFTLSMMILPVVLVHAQTNLIFYLSGDQMNSPNLNPAFLMSQQKFTFSFFPISGMSVGYNNQSIINNMLIDVVQGNRSQDKFKGIFRSMLKTGLFYQRMEIPYFNFGYHSKLGSFNFRIKDNMQVMTALNGEVSDFLSSSSHLSVQLNQPQTFPVNALYYREYSLGYAKEIIKDKLTAGIRAKIYFGKFGLVSDVQGVAVRKDDNNFYIQTSKQLKLSFPAKIIQDENRFLTSISTADNFSVGEFLLNSSNTGSGFDIGFNYRVNADLVISGSVIDIGKINWKSDINSMDYSGDYLFPQESIKYGDNQVLTRKEFVANDSIDIPDLFMIERDSSKFATNMPVTFHVGLQYRVSPELEIGLVNRLIRTNNMSYYSILISGDFEVNKNLNILTGYAIQGNSFNNVPLAVIYNWRGGQYFVGTDSFFSLIFPAISDFSGITFGVSLFLNPEKANREKQVDYLPFYLQKKKKPTSFQR